MIEELEEILKREKEFFSAIYDRLLSFSARKDENQTFTEIYQAYYDSYQTGSYALFHFEQSIERYKQGDFSGLKQISGMEVLPVPQTQAGGVIWSMLAACRLPSGMFRTRLHTHIRQIAQRMVYLLTYTQEQPDLIEDFQEIASLLITFEHVDIETEKQEESGFIGKAASFGLGALAGVAGKKIYKKVKESL